MNWKWCGKKYSWLNLRYFPQGLRIVSSIQDFNWALLKYKSAATILGWTWCYRKRSETAYGNQPNLILEIPHFKTNYASFSWNVCGLVTGYGLDGPGIESRWRRDFLRLSRLAPGPTQPPVQWVSSLSRGLRVVRAWHWPLTPF